MQRKEIISKAIKIPAHVSRSGEHTVRQVLDRKIGVGRVFHERHGANPCSKQRTSQPDADLSLRMRIKYTSRGFRKSHAHKLCILFEAHHQATANGREMTRASYTVDFKLSVVEWVKSGDRSLREASKTFGVDRKCIRQWIRESDNLGSARVRQGPQTRKLHGGRSPLSEELDSLVLSYLLERRRRGEVVDDTELRQKAVEGSGILGLGDFKASPSWLRGWKARTGVGEPRPSVESLPREAPTGSSLVSHVRLSDSVLLSDYLEKQPNGSQNATEFLSTRSNGSSHVINHVITPDHTYSRKPSSEFVPPSDLAFTASSSSNTNTASRSSFVKLVHPPMGGHLLESSNQLLLSDSSQQYSGIQSMACDPVMSSTQFDIHYSVLDISSVPLEQEVLISGADVGSFAPTPSLSSLSPPKRSTLDTRSLLWPSLGCFQTSPVTFPEFHEFTDTLTGLLANRRSEPVFPARPEILMSNSDLS